IGAAQRVEAREEEVRREVGDDHHAEEARPGHRQQRVVDAQRAEERQPAADDVEGAVVIEEAPAARAPDPGTEAQVAGGIFLAQACHYAASHAPEVNSGALRVGGLPPPGPRARTYPHHAASRAPEVNSGALRVGGLPPPEPPEPAYRVWTSS